MTRFNSRTSTPEENRVRAWGGTLAITTMLLALIALPVGFVMQLPLVLGLSIAGIVAGGIALTS